MDRILFFSLIGIWCIISFFLNAKHLYESIVFYNEVKKLRKLKMISATVIRENTSFLNMMMTVQDGGPTSVKAKVKAVNHPNKTYNMVCSHDKRIKEGMNVEIILCKEKNVFAFSVQQIKNALVTYSTYCILFLCASYFMIWTVYSIASEF